MNHLIICDGPSWIVWECGPLCCFAAIPCRFAQLHHPQCIASCQDNLVSKPEFTVAFNLAATDSFLKISSGELERCNFCAWLAAIGMKLSDWQDIKIYDEWMWCFWACLCCFFFEIFWFWCLSVFLQTKGIVHLSVLRATSSTLSSSSSFWRESPWSWGFYMTASGIAAKHGTLAQSTKTSAESWW